MAAAPNADRKAVEAANQALALLKSGNATRALKLAEESLKACPDHPALLQVAGLSALQNGDSKRAASALQKALQINPEQPGLWEIYGGALEILDQHEDALSAYDEAVNRAPKNISGHRLRGTVLSEVGSYEEALDAFDTALTLSEQEPDIWILKGTAHLAIADLEAAKSAFQKAATLDPTAAKAWVNLAIVKNELGQREVAMDHFQTALSLAPDDSTIMSRVATAFWEMQLPDQAENLFKNAIALDPNNVIALSMLATLYEQTNRLREAAEFARRALNSDPQNLQAQKVQAVLERRKGDPAKALAEVESLFAQARTPADKESLAYELGRLNDRLGHTDRAYTNFKDANQLQADSPAGKRVDAYAYLQQVEHEANILANSPPQNPPPSSSPDSPPDPIFLIGFPRSGTTLLDQVLDSHPDIAVMDERPPLADVHERLIRLEESSDKAFIQLDEEQRQIARQFYFERAEQFVSGIQDKVFVDKHPLGTSKIRIIKLLFPQARIIFALRHPCDVVLSCFMQRFTVNMAMANFHTLLGAVAAYEAVMDLWLQSNEGLGLPVHKIRYEDVVQDFETQVRGLLAFLEVPWDERVVAFHEHAQARHVRTASSSQVTEPLYSYALARWERYKQHLLPHMDALQPFIKAFGYDSDIQKGN